MTEQHEAAASGQADEQGNEQGEPEVVLTTAEGVQRFEIRLPGQSEPAGFAEAIDHEARDGSLQRIFPHTVVQERFQGQGLASQLVRSALDQTIAEGRQIVATCSYVRSWLDRHEDYQSHVAKVTPDHLARLS